jgi:endogenous inhibitor of DNA gyrase (YacG/DUF329 family)
MIQCPICNKEVTPTSAEFPFCSERCRIIDLGNWASEKYRIASDPNSEAPRDGGPEDDAE